MKLYLLPVFQIFKFLQRVNDIYKLTIASQKKVVHCLKLELEAYRNALTNGTRFSVTSGQYFSPNSGDPEG
jgi:hypothetical protein